MASHDVSPELARRIRISVRRLRFRPLVVLVAAGLGLFVGGSLATILGSRAWSPCLTLPLFIAGLGAPLILAELWCKNLMPDGRLEGQYVHAMVNLFGGDPGWYLSLQAEDAARVRELDRAAGFESAVARRLKGPAPGA